MWSASENSFNKLSKLKFDCVNWNKWFINIRSNTLKYKIIQKKIAFIDWQTWNRVKKKRQSKLSNPMTIRFISFTMYLSFLQRWFFFFQIYLLLSCCILFNNTQTSSKSSAFILENFPNKNAAQNVTKKIISIIKNLFIFKVSLNQIHLNFKEEKQKKKHRTILFEQMKINIQNDHIFCLHNHSSNNFSPIHFKWN